MISDSWGEDMTIRDRIFDKLDELNMTQKEFSEKTGIAQSTVSDWRKKRTNPTADTLVPDPVKKS